MSNFLRNRVTERDIRDWFDQNGYEGGSAVLESVELFAIERPGWKQLFCFNGKVRLKSSAQDEDNGRNAVWGLVIDDERKPAKHRTDVQLFESENEQQEQLSLLSADMLTATRNRDRSGGVWPMLLIGLLFATVLLIIAMAKKFL